MGTWILKSQSAFDENFAHAPPLGLQANGLGKKELQVVPADAFDSHQILALAIWARSEATYDNSSVSRLDDTIRVSYRSSVPENERWPRRDYRPARLFVSPLLLLVPSKAMEGVKKIEFNQEGCKPVIVPYQPEG